MSAFKVGDRVCYKGTYRSMQVQGVQGSMVTCAWIDKDRYPHSVVLNAVFLEHYVPLEDGQVPPLFVWAD